MRNIVLKDTLAYLAVDYCGMEVVNIADPSNIQLIGWWNPYGCPNNNWYTSPVHANEIRYDADCEVLFLSTGKSDLFVLDVSDPLQTDSVDYYGGVSNNLGTWGVNIYQNQIYLSYICVPWPYIPFESDSTGVKILSYTNCSTGIEELNSLNIQVSPNPVVDDLTLVIDEVSGGWSTVSITSITGELLYEEKLEPKAGKINLNMNRLSSGVYFLAVKNANGSVLVKFVKE